MVDQHGLISMQLEAKLKEKIDVPLTEKVQFTQEQENFHRYACTRVKLYVVFFIYSPPSLPLSLLPSLPPSLPPLSVLFPTVSSCWYKTWSPPVSQLSTQWSR